MLYCVEVRRAKDPCGGGLYLLNLAPTFVVRRGSVGRGRSNRGALWRQEFGVGLLGPASCKRRPIGPPHPRARRGTSGREVGGQVRMRSPLTAGWSGSLAWAAHG